MERLVVFEIDIDGTSGCTNTRSLKCVVGVEDSGESIDGLTIAVVYRTESCLVANFKNVVVGERVSFWLCQLELESTTNSRDIGKWGAWSTVDIEAERILIECRIGI